ncbi:MAG: hypothetical protein Q7J32_14200 [Sphingomonadaceae bacterium]|nr:hypothetical protein [Sphingomonadaceae bacterium]
MTTTTWTSAHLAALETAIAKGIRRVGYADRTVEYGSMAEMLQLRATMSSAIAGTDQGDGQVIFAGRIN